MAEKSCLRWATTFSLILFLLVSQVSAEFLPKDLTPQGRLAKVTMVFATPTSSKSTSTSKSTESSLSQQISPTTSLPADSQYFTVLNQHDTLENMVEATLTTSLLDPIGVATTTEFPYSLLMGILKSHGNDELSSTITATPVLSHKTVPTYLSFYTLPPSKATPSTDKPTRPQTSTEATTSTNDPDVSSLLGDISLALGSFRPPGSSSKRPANSTDPAAVDKIIADLMNILRPQNSSSHQVAFATPTLETLPLQLIRPTSTRKPLKTAFRPIRPSIMVSSPGRFPLRRRPLLTAFRPSPTSTILPVISSEFDVLNAIKDIQASQLIPATTSKTTQILPTAAALQSIISALRATATPSSTVEVTPTFNEAIATSTEVTAEAPGQDTELQSDAGAHEEIAPQSMETNYWQEKDVVLNKVKFTLKPVNLVNQITTTSEVPVEGEEDIDANDKEVNGVVADVQHGVLDEVSTTGTTKPAFVAFGSANPVPLEVHVDDQVTLKIPGNLQVGGEIQVFGDLAVGSGSLVVKQKTTTTERPVVLLVATKGTTVTTPLPITKTRKPTTSPPAEVAALPLEIDERPLQTQSSSTLPPKPTKTSSVVTHTIFNTVVSVSTGASEDEPVIHEFQEASTASDAKSTVGNTELPTSTTPKMTTRTTTASRRRTRRPTRATTPIPAATGTRRPLRRPTTPTSKRPPTTRPTIRLPSGLGLGLSLLPVAVIATVLGVPFVLAAAGRKKREVQEDDETINNLHETLYKSFYDASSRQETRRRRRR